MSTEFKDTLAHTQLGANQDVFGSWNRAMKAANAIEAGDVSTLRDVVSQATDVDKATELVERVVTVSARYR
ncbi:hypothetical protein AMR41_30740 [Hapalosiphon sp. MRB220]|nr:hypothetical protein AMR41_30740 [Hapalosiphon sp. MRB220]